MYVIRLPKHIHYPELTAAYRCAVLRRAEPRTVQRVQSDEQAELLSRGLYVRGEGGDSNLQSLDLQSGALPKR